MMRKQINAQGDIEPGSSPYVSLLSVITALAVFAAAMAGCVTAPDQAGGDDDPSTGRPVTTLSLQVDRNATLDDCDRYQNQPYIRVYGIDADGGFRTFEGDATLEFQADKWGDAVHNFAYAVEPSDFEYDDADRPFYGTFVWCIDPDEDGDEFTVRTTVALIDGRTLDASLDFWFRPSSTVAR